MIHKLVVKSLSFALPFVVTGIIVAFILAAMLGTACDQTMFVGECLERFVDTYGILR